LFIRTVEPRERRVRLTAIGVSYSDPLLIAIRKDLGHVDGYPLPRVNRLLRGDLLRLFVNDIDDYLKD